MRFSVKHLLLATLAIACAMAVVMYCWRNLGRYNHLIGLTCIVAIPIIPFAMPILAYALARNEKQGTQILITFIAMATEIGIAIACYFLLGHIVREFWV